MILYRKGKYLKGLVILIILISNYPLLASGQEIEEARRFATYWVTDSCRDLNLFNKATDKYLSVLKQDSLNLEANYELAQLYKKMAVNYSTNIHKNVNTWSNERIKQESNKGIEYISKGEPFMERYNRLATKRKN